MSAYSPVKHNFVAGRFCVILLLFLHLQFMIKNLQRVGTSVALVSLMVFSFAAVPLASAKVLPKQVIPAGATAICKDGTFSFAKNHSGSCSHHKGVAKFYR